PVEEGPPPPAPGHFGPTPVGAAIPTVCSPPPALCLFGGDDPGALEGPVSEFFEIDEGSGAARFTFFAGFRIEPSEEFVAKASDLVQAEDAFGRFGFSRGPRTVSSRSSFRFLKGDFHAFFQRDVERDRDEGLRLQEFPFFSRRRRAETE